MTAVRRLMLMLAIVMILPAAVFAEEKKDEEAEEDTSEDKIVCAGDARTNCICRDQGGDCIGFLKRCEGNSGCYHYPDGLYVCTCNGRLDPNPASQSEPSTSMPDGTVGAFPQLPREQVVGKGRTFPNPKVGKKRVDWCRHFGRECGGPAANTFCERSGKGSATGWKKATDVGPTYVLGDRKTCGDRGCDGFASITCSDDKYRTFDEPMVVGDRLDWCLRWGDQCGKPAASAFCQSQGFSRARRFEKAEDVGPTHVIGTRRHCPDKGCDGFKSIQCAS